MTTLLPGKVALILLKNLAKTRFLPPYRDRRWRAHRGRTYSPQRPLSCAKNTVNVVNVDDAFLRTFRVEEEGKLPLLAIKEAFGLTRIELAYEPGIGEAVFIRGARTLSTRTRLWRRLLLCK